MTKSFFMPIADDMHCHLRQDEMLNFTVKAVKEGGCNRILVMPNTNPIINNCNDALRYKNELLKYDRNIDYLMTLYLNKNTDENDIILNHEKCNLQGIKIYPSNVTTNSQNGVTNLEPFYKIFNTLEKLNKSLHIHCEECNINPLYAEKEYLHRIYDLAIKFPHLKIVLEHITTESSINIIKNFSNLAGSITPHHLYLTIDDVINMDNFDYSMDNIYIENYIKCVYNYCKPLPKSKINKDALINLIKENFDRIFLGSDSAPHYKELKKKPSYKAGIYTQPFLISYLCNIFYQNNCLDKLENFCCKNASNFLNLKKKNLNKDEIALFIEKKKFKIPDNYFNVIPFLYGETMDFTISYKIYNE